MKPGTSVRLSAALLLVVYLSPVAGARSPPHRVPGAGQSHPDGAVKGDPERWSRQDEGVFPSRPPLVVPTPVTRPTRQPTTEPTTQPTTEPTTQPTTQPTSTSTSPALSSTTSPLGLDSSALPSTAAATPPPTTSSTTSVPMGSWGFSDSRTTVTVTTKLPTTAPWVPTTSSLAVSNDATPEVEIPVAAPPTSPASTAGSGYWGLISLAGFPGKQKLGHHRVHVSQPSQQVLVAPLKWAQVIPHQALQAAWVPSTTPSPAPPSNGAQHVFLVPVSSATHQHPLFQRLHSKQKQPPVASDAAFLVGLPWQSSDVGGVGDVESGGSQQYGLLSLTSAEVGKPSVHLKPSAHGAAFATFVPLKNKHTFRHRDLDLMLPRTEDVPLPPQPCGQHWDEQLEPYLGAYYQPDYSLKK